MHYRNQRPISLRNNKDLLASHALEHFGLRPHVLVYGWRRMLIQKRKTRMRCKHLSAFFFSSFAHEKSVISHAFGSFAASYGSLPFGHPHSDTSVSRPRVLVAERRPISLRNNKDLLASELAAGPILFLSLAWLMLIPQST